AFALVVEAGLGSGYRDFRNLRLHTLPGPLPATELWPAQAARQPSTVLHPAYQQPAHHSGDVCCLTMLASKPVATPFVGPLPATPALAELVRPLHGGGVHASLDCPLRSLTHRLGEPTPANARCAFIALP